MTKTSELARALKPFVQSWFSEWAGGVGYRGGASSGGSSSGTVGAHDLFNTTIHTGQLLEAQATWAATKVELSTHAALPNVHHAQSHVLATNSGLGADHTVSGATAGHVLRATSSTAAAFAQLQHSDLGGVTANQHHNQIHVLADGSGLGADHTISGGTAGYVLRATGTTTAAIAQLQHNDLGGVTANQHHNQIHDIVGSDHTITAAAWNVPGSTALDTLGLLQARSSTLSTAETLLKSDGAGGIYLNQLGINTNSPARLFHILDNTGAQMRLGYDATNYMDFLVDNGGSWRVAPTGDIIVDPGGNDMRPLNNYDVNLGTPVTKYLALYAAELWVDTLVASEVRSTVGGKVNVAPTTELTRTLAGSSLTYDTITQRGTTTSNSGAGGSVYNTVTFRAAASNNANTSSLSVNRPTGTVDGDVLIAVVAWWIETLTPPSGWTQIGSTQTWNISGEDVFVRAYYRVASSEPTSYAWGLSGTNDIAVSIATYYNVNTGSVVDVQAGQTNAANTSMTAPSVSPTTDADMLLFLGGAGSDSAGSATATPPSGMTERADATAGTWIKTYIAEQLLTAAGATGTRVATLSTSENNAGILVALTPSSSGGGNTSVIVNRPTGVVNDDVMLASVAYAGGTLTAPAGWTQVLSQAGTGVTLRVYRRVASSEGSTYTWSLDSSDGLAVSISAYYNVDTSTPTPVSNSQANSSSTSMTAPTITPGAPTGLLFFAGAVAGDIRATAPGGMTEEADLGATAVGVYAADQALSTIDPTGTRTATLASAAANAAANVYLLPSSSGGAAPTTIYVRYNNLNNGDRVLMEARGQFEAMAVTSAYTVITPNEEYSYTVTRNLDGTGANDWVEGDAILNTGQTGNGWLELYAQYGLVAAGESANQRIGPTIVGNVRASNTWNDFSPRFAAGSLNGLYDYATTVYGFAAGNPAATWVALDDTDGLRFMNVLAEVGYIRPNGNWQFYGDANNYISWNGSTMTVRGDIVVTGAVDWNNVTGSPNLVRNSSFELDSDATGAADYFNVYNNDGGAVPTTGSIVSAERSQRAQRIAWTGTNASTKGIWFTITETKANDVDYVLSFWARTNTATSVQFYENAPASTKTWLTSQTTSTTWTYYAVRLNWPTAGGAPADNNFYISILNGAAIANGWIEFDNVQVTRGSERVPYTASPVDIVGYGGVVNMPFPTAGTIAAGLYLTNNYMGYWNGSSWRAYIQSNGNAYFGDGSTQYMSWNGTALTISGTINVVGGGFSGVNYAGAATPGGAANSITGQGALATANSAAWGSQVSGRPTELTDGRIAAGLNASGYVSLPLRSSNIASDTAVAGLNLTSTHLGYHNGSSWQVWIQSSGSMYFGGNSGDRLEWDGSRLSGYNSSGDEQWYAGSSTGQIVAGGGDVTLSSDGITLQAGLSSTYDLPTIIDWRNGTTLTGVIYNYLSSSTTVMRMNAIGTSTYPTAQAMMYALSNSVEQWVEVLATAVNNSDPFFQVKLIRTTIGNSYNINALWSTYNLTRITTTSGYVDIGPQNSTYCHIQTDRGSFYFNVPIRVNDTITSHDADLVLQRNAVTGLTIGTGGAVTTASSLTVTGTLGAGWFALSTYFGTDWVNYNAGYQTARFRKFGDLVVVEGLVSLSAGTVATVATLPSGYRPTSGQIMFAQQASTGVIRIDVTTGGAINVVGGATTGMWLSLTGISFFTA